MIREIIRDQFFLRMPSRPATAGDTSIADDLVETLGGNADRCVGMAANMIGENVRIIAFFDDGGRIVEMFNPVLLRGDHPYQTQESCLSLEGSRPARRYQSIRVQWQTREFKSRIRSFSGFTAQIIQHELDHLEGTLI